ncbi:MAG: lysophospholipid acyltransferase family protein, partial [Thermomicrobiales bacterium]
MLRGAGRNIVRSLILGAGKVAFRLRVEGAENIPVSGPLLVASNHVHNLDPVILAAAFPRELHFMAKKELFETPVLGRVIAWLGGF